MNAQRGLRSAYPVKATLPFRQTAALRQIRILVAHDPTICDDLGKLLATQPDFVVVGEAPDGTEALRLADELKPDIVLFDRSMPGLVGLSVIRAMSGASRQIRTIVLMTAIEKPDVVKLLQSGARGVVLRASPNECIFKSIRKVHAGELWADRETITDVVDALVASTDGERSEMARDFGLTPREHQILLRVVQGDTNRSVAERLSIGESTVKHHLTSIFNKTGASSRLELALFALHHRLIQQTSLVSSV